MPERKQRPRHLRRYSITGIITVIPLWITWLIFNFVFKQLSKAGMPWAQALSTQIKQAFPNLAQWLLEPWFLNSLSVLLTLLVLYLIGWFTSRVIGKRIVALVDLTFERIPLVQTIYGSTKKLLSVLQQKPDSVQRVVLINFPSPEMKTVGFVTRVMKDEHSGRELAAVYVPTTPNPTSGYLEIVPVECLVSTDWTMEQAMTFIISGGAVAPEKIRYENPSVPKAPEAAQN